MLLKADKCWIQVHKNSSEGYERYLEKLKRMDGRELTDEVEEKKEGFGGRGN